MRHPYFDLTLPIPVGHRGASGELPENTLPAFARALEQGARILETDVHPTSDGVAVIFHDHEVDRTTDGSGPIAAKTLRALKALDAGHRFTPDGGASFPCRGQGITVPTLEEAFAAFPDARFNIEIKQGDRAFIEQVVKLVAHAGRAERTLLTSAGDDLIAELRSVLATTGVEAAMGASTGDCVRFVKAAAGGGEPPPEPMALQIPTEFGGQPLVTPELLAFAHAHDVQVHVWTVNDPAEIERLLALGVDAVMSDFPIRVVEAIARHAVEASGRHAVEASTRRP
jgi:glycerophosphoryl diester phosphodiesterase